MNAEGLGYLAALDDIFLLLDNAEPGKTFEVKELFEYLDVLEEAAQKRYLD